MRFLAKYFNLKGAKTINIVTLVKRAKNEFNPINPQSYVSSFRRAFECEDEWLIGYGMDSTGGYKRNLKAIFAL
jgi:hypoxanthine-guanine phosphoribosyltransferase